MITHLIGWTGNTIPPKKPHSRPRSPHRENGQNTVHSNYKHVAHNLRATNVKILHIFFRFDGSTYIASWTRDLISGCGLKRQCTNFEYIKSRRVTSQGNDGIGPKGCHGIADNERETLVEYKKSKAS